MRNSPFNKNSTYVLFELYFYVEESEQNNPTTFNKTHPVAFCDNIHLSLEVSSIAELVPPISGGSRKSVRGWRFF